MRHALYCALCAMLVFLMIATGFRYISDFWLFSFFFSFQAHIGLALMAGAIVAYYLKRGAFPLIIFGLSTAIACHAVIMQREFLADGSIAVPANARSIRLLSINVLGSNWEGAGAVADTILASGADVVYMLEAEPMTPQLARLSATYPHRIGCGIATSTCDLVVMSKHPFTAQTYRNLSDLRRDRFAVVDIDFDGRTVRFVAMHLTKPYFDDYHTDELMAAAWIIRQMGGDFVVAGDFNSASIAPDMQRFLRRFKMRTGNREPSTWPTIAGAWGIPIDHVYATPGILIRNLDAVDNNGSNHYGLMADMVLLPQ